MINNKYRDSKEDKVDPESELTGNKFIDDFINADNSHAEQCLKHHEFLFLLAHAENGIKLLKDFKGCLKMMKSSMLLWFS